MPTDDFGYDLDRRAERLYADMYGFFWLPCALCGFERGGHESHGEPGIPVEGRPYISHGVCRRHPNAEREYTYVDAHAKPISQDSELPS